MSLLDGDYNSIEPTPEELAEIAPEDEVEVLFDEEEYEIISNGSDGFSSEAYPFGHSEYDDED